MSDYVCSTWGSLFPFIFICKHLLTLNRLNVGIGAEEGVVVGAAEVVGEDVLAVHRATMQKEKKPRMKRTTP